MNISLRRLINMVLFTLLAPIISYEEAAREIALGNKKEDKIFLKCVVTNRRIKGPEWELVEAARSYEYSGLEHGVYFEYLFLKLSMFIENLKKRLSEYHVAVLTMTIGLTLLSLILIVLTGSTVSLLIVCLSCILVLFLIHVLQVRILEYRYSKPMLVGFTTAMSALFLSALVFHINDMSMLCEVSIISFSVPFLVLYLPQFLNFMKLMLNLRSRIMRPFYELLWNPVPIPIRGSTEIEREFSRVFEKGREIGAPWFIARINKVVEILLDLLTTIHRQGLIYAMFVPAGFLTVLFIVKMLYLNMVFSSHMFLTAATIPLFYMPDIGKIRLFLLTYGYVTGLVTGKMIHSIGIGVLVGLLLTIITSILIR